MDTATTATAAHTPRRLPLEALAAAGGATIGTWRSLAAGALAPGALPTTTVESWVGASLMARMGRQPAMVCGRSRAVTAKPASTPASTPGEKPDGPTSTSEL